MSTPKLASKFCELKLRGGNFYDEDTGTHVFDKRMQPVCNPRLNSLDDAFRENVPFVLSNSYFCGSSYLFSVEQYNKMRNYEKNLAAFEAAIEDGSLVPNSELFLKKVGAFGQLPWKFNGSTPRAIATTIAIDLVRRHEGYFIPSLKDNAAWQASLLDIGEATMMRESFLLGNKYKQDEAARIKFRETLREEILRLSSYIEKDPEFRDRLLQED
jgi:hypothetical protein